MECKLSELVKRGHDQAAELKSSCGAVDVRDVAQLISDLATQLDVQLARSNALAAENAGLKDFVKTCFHAAGDGCDMDGNDIQELGERLGLFGRETYQPALHGYICGHEAGEDTVYVMNKTPATDAFLAEVRASTAPDEATERDLFEEWVMESVCISKPTLEGLRTDGGYRHSTLSGKDYNGMWEQWKAIRAAQLRQGGERELTNLERNVLECAAVIAKDR